MRKILIVNRLGIGDVVLTTPLAKIIKDKLPDTKIGYVVAPKAADLLKNHPYIDDVFAYNKKTKAAVIAKVKELGYTEAINVDERLSSTLFAHKAGCRLLNSGYEISIGKYRLFKRVSHAVKAIEDFATYASLLGVSYNKDELKPVIGACDKDSLPKINSWLKQLKPKTSKLVLVAAKTAFDNKNWSRTELGKFNEYLNQQGIIPAYIGSPADREYIDAIAGDKCNIAGEFSMRDLPYIAKEAAFALSMCTGPLHILATTDIPLVVIYGPSDPKRWAPKNAVVVQSTLPCVPCERWADCSQPQGQTCMDEISFERVKKIIAKFIS